MIAPAFVVVPFRVANARGVTTPVLAGRITRRALTQPGHFGKPWIVTLCEVAPVDVREVTDSLDRWEAVQRGDVSSPHAGVAICHNRRHVERLHDVRFKVGSSATAEGGGIRMRPILTERYRAFDHGVHARDVDLSSVHNPPDRAARAQVDFMADVRLTGGIVAGDFNEAVTAMKDSTARQYRGIEVLGAIVPRWIDVSTAWPVDIGSDHEAVDVLLRIPVARSRHA